MVIEIEHLFSYSPRISLNSKRSLRIQKQLCKSLYIQGFVIIYVKMNILKYSKESPQIKEKL